MVTMGGPVTAGQTKRGPFGPLGRTLVRAALRQLRVQHSQPPALHVQAALDLAELFLEARVLPMLDHGASLFLEPLLFHLRPFGDGGVESLVLVRDALAYELDLRLAGGR